MESFSAVMFDEYLAEVNYFGPLSGQFPSAVLFMKKRCISVRKNIYE